MKEQRIENFEKLGFGLFVHYGLYSLLEKGEWVYDQKPELRKEYSSLMNDFSAEKFDTDRLAQLAKKAGAKYIVLTLRHHDGFSLYDTKGLNCFDAPHSKAKRDIAKDFVESCNKYGIVPFFYHTTLDWYEESFHTDFKSYQKYLRKSIELLCTNYGKIGGFWFDGNWSKPDEDWEEDELYRLIRQYQPDAIIINNSGLHQRGKHGNEEIDSVTFERGRPEFHQNIGDGKYRAGEMCQTFNSHWGCASTDFSYKSVQTILRDLIECRRFSCNFLLNIGPLPDGSIRLIEQGMLEEIGNWIRIFGESIYDTAPCQIKCFEEDGFVLSKGDDYYLFVFDLWVNGDGNVSIGSGTYKEVRLQNISIDDYSIKWIDNGEQLKYSVIDNEIVVHATPFEYGSNYVVRVAKISKKEI